MDNDSKRRLRHMLQEEDNNIDLGVYGLGDVRTHTQYENYAGINFKNKKLHTETIKGTNPPVNDNTDWYELKEIEYEFKLYIPYTENFKFIYIGIENELGNVLHRQDMYSYQEYLNVKLKTTETPVKWVYWVNDKEGNWVNRIDFSL